jgi:hypothetical protein
MANLPYLGETTSLLARPTEPAPEAPQEDQNEGGSGDFGDHNDDGGAGAYQGQQDPTLWQRQDSSTSHHHENQQEGDYGGLPEHYAYIGEEEYEEESYSDDGGVIVLREVRSAFSPASQGQQRQSEQGSHPLYNFSARASIGILSLAVVVFLLIFLVSVVDFGTRCPPASAGDASGLFVVHNSALNRTWNVTSFECANPARWFNPDRKGGSDAFLGTFQLPPGLSAVFGAAVSIAGIAFFGFVGVVQVGLRGRNDARRTLRIASAFSFLFWLFLVVCNAISWSAVVTTNADTNPRICLQLASQVAFPLCDYLMAQLVICVFVTLLLGLLTWRSNQKIRGGGSTF